jgi:replicative DNA helicase
MSYKYKNSHKKEPLQLSENEFAKGKTPPQADSAERAVIGAMLIDRDCIHLALESVKPHMLYSESNSIIFQTISQLFNSGRPVDLVTVKTEINKQGKLDKIGGAITLVELTSDVASGANVEYHCTLIHENYIKRSLILIGNTQTRDGFTPEIDGFEQLEKAQSDLFELASGIYRKNFISLDKVVFDNLKELEARSRKAEGITGISTGFKKLDEITSGWQPSDLIVIGARPGMGKTVLALNFAKSACLEHNIPGAFFSLEMSTPQLTFRLQSSVSEVEGNAIRSGRLSPEQWERLNSDSGRLSKVPLYFDDTPGISIQELRAKAVRLKYEKDIQIIFIDYIQLMTCGGLYTGSREQEISLISRSLKGLAKDLNVPIIALSQLSRQVESRAGGKRPGLADLRESGAIEQDADIVIFPHRPEYYGEQHLHDGMTPAIGKAEIIIAKQRNGALGECIVDFQGQYSRFTEEQYNEFSSQFPAKIQPSSRFNEVRNPVQPDKAPF